MPLTDSWKASGANASHERGQRLRLATTEAFITELEPVEETVSKSPIDVPVAPSPPQRITLANAKPLSPEFHTPAAASIRQIA